MKKLTTADFIARARKIHGDKYDYSKSEYVNSGSKITITCKIHGDFNQEVSSHFKRFGCRKCKSVNQSITKRFTLTDFINQARKIHSDRYNYDKVEYSTAHAKIIITCSIHGDFLQSANNHLSGNGCRSCSFASNKSRIANEWLDSIGIAEEHRELTLKEYPRRPVDAYVAETNTVYQFHGDYWHGNSKVFESSKLNTIIGKTMGELYEKTIAWDQKIRELNYNLVVMWENDYLKNSLIDNP